MNVEEAKKYLKNGGRITAPCMKGAFVYPDGHHARLSTDDKIVTIFDLENLFNQGMPIEEFVCMEVWLAEILDRFVDSMPSEFKRSWTDVLDMGCLGHARDMLREREMRIKREEK